MSKLITIAAIYLTSFFAFGQNKVLVFYDGVELTSVKALIETAPSRSIVLDTSSNATFFNENVLKNYRAVIFLNVSANRLNFRESAELQRFIQAGGGFTGIGRAVEASNKWLWYQKILGGELADNQLENPIQLNLISNASIGKTTLPPLWKVNDKPLVFKALSTRFKPVLLDVTGKTWAWYYTTEEGGKLFYTALGHEPSAFTNSDLVNHIWAGIEEVSAKALPDYTRIAGTALPVEKNFLKIVLTNDLQNPVAVATRRDNSVLVVEESGNVKLYDSKKRKTALIGKIDVPNLKGIRLDPEFYQNGYVYTFSETAPDGYTIGRMQVVGDTSLVMTDFTSRSTNPLIKSAVYEFERYAREPYKLPRYFDKKSFRYDAEQGLIAETFDEDGNVKNIEPFLTDTKFTFIKDLSFGADGGLYFLEDDQLKKIDYAEGNRKPVAIASADVSLGNAPLKVKFSSEGSIDFDKDDQLSFEWNFDGVNISSEPNPEFVFLKPGTYEVKLKASDKAGETSGSSLKIQVNKAPVKGKKR